jgi:hypothetical protein
MPVRGGIRVSKRGLHPDLAIAHLDWTHWRVVRPQIEGAAAFEIKAGVMPMTGQNAVLDTAALERKAHVRATVVKREDAPAVVYDEIGRWRPCTTSRPFAFSSSRVPAKANSLLGASMFLWAGCRRPDT